MTRIAIVSDIHGNLAALEAVVADAQGRGCTSFANLGDSLSGPLWPRETAAFLMERDWPTIAGNHERYILAPDVEGAGKTDAYAREQCTPAQRAWLAALPESMLLPGAWCTHARPGVDDEWLLESATVEGEARAATEPEIVERVAGVEHALILHGHSHVQRLVTLGDGRTIANPGSVGLPRHLAGVSAGGPEAQYAILQRDAVHLHRVAYDHEAAAGRAQANGNAKWARMLREGAAR